MSWKVKRGLGLLVVAALALIALIPLLDADPSGDLSTFVLVALTLAVGLAFAASVLGGLALLAWGLLRD